MTEFEFRLHAIGPQVVSGPIFWPAEEAPNVLRFYRDWIADCPDELTTNIGQRKAPGLPGMPADLVGKRVISVVCCYAGPVEQGEKMVRPLKGFGSPVLDLCVPKRYLTQQTMFDASWPRGRCYYIRSCDVAELNDDTIDIMVEYGNHITSPITAVGLWQLGGAVARVGEDETAFNRRVAGHTFNLAGSTESAAGFDEEREWARSYWSALSRYHTGVYVNFLMDEGEERIRQAYGAEKYDRLKSLKRRYDPANFFRLNQNISPD